MYPQRIERKEPYHVWTEGVITALEFQPHGEILASGGSDADVMLWDVKSGKQLSVLQGHTGPVGTLSFSADGSTLLSAGDDAILWNCLKFKEVWYYPTPYTRAIGQFAPLGSCFSLINGKGIGLYLNVPGSILPFDKYIPKSTDGFRNGAAIIDLSFSDKGRLLCVADTDDTVRIWDIVRKRLLAILLPRQ